MAKNIVVFAFALFLTGTAAAQTKTTDSQTLEAILGEIRQLRQDLRTATMAAQRAQILLYRVQVEDAVVRRLQDRAEDTRSKLAQTQHEKQRLIDYLKLNEDSQEKIEDPRTRKEAEDAIARFKASVETQSSLEQETQRRLMEYEEQLRIEQAKLSTLQGELDQLDKKLQ